MLVTQSAKRGLPLPPKIADAPSLLETVRLYWQCFFDLRRGLDKYKAIPWRDVQFWCDTFKLDGELSRAVHAATLELDVVWAELHPPPKPSGQGDGNGNKRRG